MASHESILSVPPVSDNVDLVRRYCPTLAVHTHAQVAAHLLPDSSSCWSWDGYITEAGYGEVWCEPTPYGYKTSVPTHRYMYDTLVGPIPYGYHVHHRCGYRACWNPLHLEAVTPQEHCQRHGRGRQPAVPWHAPVQLALAFG